MQKKEDLVLVTGASGFIGGHVARKFYQEGFRVRAQYRRPEPPINLKQLESDGVELYRTDLSSESGHDKLVEGVDHIIHVAAKTSDWGPYEEFYRINYLSTLELLNAAKKASVDNFIYLSSISVHGFGPHNGSTEKGPYYPLQSSYQETKKMAEEAVIESTQDNFSTHVIRAGNVYGPDDTTTFYPIFDAMLDGKMSYVNKGQALTCPVFIDDLLQAIYKAFMSRETSGEAFNITSGEKVSWKELCEVCAEALGIPAPRRSFPYPLAITVAKSIEALYKLISSSKGPDVTAYRVKQVAYDYSFSIEKARSLLSYNPKVCIREGMKRTAEAYLQNKAEKANGDLEGS